jgi:catechol 2,3-dioxygenase-like lactoylglutathione lyase family enzyme
MFDHVTIRASDLGASERFYDTVLETLGIAKSHSDADGAMWQDLGMYAADGTHPATRGLHIGFVAPSREHVDRFWEAGTQAGYRDDGEPGPRPEYSDDYYGGFLLDPDGNSAEAVHHDSLRSGGVIDHLWIRVANVAASRAFYTTVAPHAGFELRLDTPERARFAGESGSFSVLAGAKPTAHFHIAFPAPDNATVDRFHAAATRAGYRDHGGPGTRPIYHEGYYGAFVLDPDGNNVEVVCHNDG